MSDDLNDQILLCTPAEIEAQVLALTDLVTAAEAAQMLLLVKSLLHRAKLIRSLLDDKLIEWIDRNGPLEVGDIQYFVGFPTTTRCIDIRQTMQLLLAGLDGDWEGVVPYLSSQPFKQGSCRSILAPADWERVFEVTRTPKLKEGKPGGKGGTQRRLIEVNTKFTDPTRRRHA